MAILTELPKSRVDSLRRYGVEFVRVSVCGKYALTSDCAVYENRFDGSLVEHGVSGDEFELCARRTDEDRAEWAQLV